MNESENDVYCMTLCKTIHKGEGRLSLTTGEVIWVYCQSGRKGKTKEILLSGYQELNLNYKM